MKIIKPDTMAMLNRTLHTASGNMLSIGLMGMFRLDQSTSSNLFPEQQLWEIAAEVIGSDAVLDDGWPKPAAEFLVYGACHAPSTGPVRQITVSARVGNIQKKLAVFGERHFNVLHGVSAPQPFQRMEMSPQQAFGGSGFADNPKGRGYAAIQDAAGAIVHPLPNIESPAALIISKRDRPAPAGFWALPAESPQRTYLLGYFDKTWLKKTWPHLPLDTQTAYFHSAPADQRSTEFFKGDESIEMTHMHPQHIVQSGALPQLRVRCFVNRRQGEADVFSEINTRAETVWLFPERECGIILYRGLAEISDSEADDVLHVMAGWEYLNDAPQSFEHYRKCFEQKLSNEFQNTAHVAKTRQEVAQPSVAKSVTPVAAAIVSAPTISAPPVIDTALMAMMEQMERDTQAMLKTHGLSGADIEKYMLPPPELRPLSDVEMEQMLAKLENDVQGLMQQNGVSAADVEKLISPPSKNPAGDLDIAALLKELDAVEASMMHGLTEQSLIEAVAAHPDTEHLLAELKQEQVDTATIINALSVSKPQAFPAAIPVITSPLSVQVADPSPALLKPPDLPLTMTRDLVIERHTAKQGFDGMDLSGLDLSSLDLSGIDFRGALLQKTDLSGANLRGSKFNDASADRANLSDACLEKSDLSNADFTDADFSHANLSEACLRGSLFNRAKMMKIHALNCDAMHASFEEADLTEGNFSDANLSGTRFNRASIKCANFRNSICEKSEFYGTKAIAAVFSDADLRDSRADADSQFDAAILSGARLEGASWEGVQLRQALLDHAFLDNADFRKIQASNATFTKASAKQTKFDKADLKGADMRGINLFRGSLRQSELHTTLLSAANLYGVNFEGATPTIACIEESNIDNTLLRFRPAVV